jgi:hypothetical protein
MKSAYRAALATEEPVMTNFVKIAQRWRQQSL